MVYDIIVKDGFVVDPASDIEDRHDVAISHGRVVALETDITDEAERIIDARGMIVTPGLIDLHAHIYHDVTDMGAHADTHCLQKGVTTVVDGGSSGASNFMGLKKFIIAASQTRILCFLSICRLGAEMGDLRHLDFNRAVEVTRHNRDVIVGIKLRLGEKRTGRFSPHYLRLAKEAAQTVGVPLMVHIFGPDPLPSNLGLPEVLQVLEKGDVITHTFHPKPPTGLNACILDSEDSLLPEVLEARKRGVLFDVGHGRYQFSWHTAEQALRHKFLPDTISTDLVKYSVNRVVYDLPTVLSKFLHMGLSLTEIIERSTSIPASILGMTERIGTLKPGADGDLAIFQLTEGTYEFWDNIGPSKQKQRIQRLLKPVMVIKRGRIIEPS